MRKLLSILALGVMLLAGGAPAAFAAQATDIVIEDTAGTLDLNTLVPAIKKISFNEPTKVAIYTRDGEYNDNLNEEVLRFARQKHPEWLSADGQKWADSLFVFALDPTGRQVGTYFGEDRKVSPAQRDDIQNATKDLYGEAQWTDGTIAGVERAAQLMNRPWYKSPKLYAWSGGILVVGGISVGSTLYVRRTYRNRSLKALDIGNASYSNVSLDLEATELNAKTINDGSRYGSLVLEKYRGFMAAYNNLAAQGNKANDMDPKSHARKETALFMEKYAAKATDLDRLDDVIADTNMLLNMGSGWAAAWERQLAPLREDLAEIDSLVIGKHAAPEAPSATNLSRFKTMTAGEMEKWGAALQSGQIGPEEALDKIAEAREQLTGMLKEYSEAVIAKFAKDKEEEKLMRAAMRTPEARGSSYSSNHSILGTVYPANRFWSVVGFSAGYHSGISRVQESRSASSSSGGSTGYGSSGGSFSGSGSSSRF
ncbi:hypothetical protein GCM10009715_09660 [Paeniglutamicibacter psychrophenolicus]|uniref:Membrane protein YgcG n=1 Tax=Paeniglutamicibacter psychrophenolicus TaxID=257454 RepID=A0ABS4WFU8_9MICC|nr:DUF5129 domain-containing protein [Paeniglutamicibacter psychrophenolicus]MBP2375066.1 putative membrane protein YgcG [Paeniglutamicibacter psychrophenolicus]